MNCRAVPRSNPPWGGDAALWCTRLWLFQEGWTGGESCSLDNLTEWGGRLENAYSECRRMEKEQWFSHLLHLSLFLTGTKENPWEAVPQLGCDPVQTQILLLSTAGCFWPLWWKQSECTLLQVFEIRLNNPFKSFTHAKK